MIPITTVRNIILQNYSNKIKTKFELSKQQNINSINYLINSGSDKFILHYNLEKSPLKKIEKMCEVLSFCHKKGCLVPKPLKTKSGNFVDQKYKTYLTQFYDGKNFSGKFEQLNDLAVHLAELHKILKHDKSKYNFRTNEKNYRILTEEEIKQFQKICEKKINPDIYDKLFMKHLTQICEFTNFYYQNYKKTNLISKQLIHFDLHLGNIIFKNNKVVAILDFNSMRKGTVVEDVSFAGLRFSLYKTNNLKQIKRKFYYFIEKYNLKNRIDERQFNLLELYLTKMILMRINYILQQRYCFNSDIWIKQLKIHLLSLRVTHKILHSIK